MARVVAKSPSGNCNNSRGVIVVSGHLAKVSFRSVWQVDRLGPMQDQRFLIRIEEEHEINARGLQTALVKTIKLHTARFLVYLKLHHSTKRSKSKNTNSLSIQQQNINNKQDA